MNKKLILTKNNIDFIRLDCFIEHVSKKSNVTISCQNDYSVESDKEDYPLLFVKDEAGYSLTSNEIDQLIYKLNEAKIFLNENSKIY